MKKKPPAKRSSSGKPGTSPLERTHQCINRFVFEGYVGADPERVVTKSGRPMCRMDVCQTQTRWGNRRAIHPVWVKTQSYDTISESVLASIREGERVMVAGNFSSQKGTYGFLMRAVVTAFWKVQSGGPTFINWWEFEGKVCSEPKVSKTVNDDDYVKFGVVQPGVYFQSDGIQRRTLPTLLNARAFGLTARQAQDYRREDKLFMAGHLQSLRRNGVAWAVADRVYPISGEFYDQRIRRIARQAQVLPPEFELGLVVI